eukprot:SAG11_NODE_7083_length_1196_cov_8.770283_2_plen_104_part_00
MVDVVRLFEAINIVLLCPYALLLRIVCFYLWGGQAADLPERVGVADGGGLGVADAAADGCEVRVGLLQVSAEPLDGFAGVQPVDFLSMCPIIQSHVVSLFFSN